jgi:ferredoxin-NADP reductase
VAGFAPLHSAHSLGFVHISSFGYQSAVDERTGEVFRLGRLFLIALFHSRRRGIMTSVYYIAGPPEMVKALHGTINESGVDEGDIRTEEFS